ncbi:LytTR family DNA-binding domain-containing protein [Sulfuriferula sp.]|uniref:LytR/AlgR family response regulator transcription factor n=1 Tax=Sulfuriferula sp. TaxID=2025307 RepID=UPI002730C896|nr:LytTR family DNA-binding domain-containing protein [Sulfuriferula sp.]MDP2027378.1 LytTR family DNA-binding domain-containing protein [Sulfuriferula sp.]
MNSPLRVLIVDDEAPARNRLRDVLADCAAALPVEVVGEAANGIAALELLQSIATDVVLLDIRMPGMDGLELAQHLARLATPPAVVFTTAYDSYAIQAFELSAVDYLLKPVRAERLAAALRKAQAFGPAQAASLQQAAPQPRQFLSACERGRILLVPVTEVIYLRAEQKYVAARTAYRTYLLDESLVNLERELAQQFVRVHRNSLVARDAIEGFVMRDGADDGEEAAGWVVLLRGLDETLPVSRRQYAVIRQFKR